MTRSRNLACAALLALTIIATVADKEDAGIRSAIYIAAVFILIGTSDRSGLA